MNINRLVLDLSHHETVQSYDQVRASGIVGIIYKATQYTSYKDDTYWKSRERALKAGLLWGSYHFAETANVQQQIQNYVDYAKPAPDELFCLDLEDYGGKTMTLAEARAWVEGVESELNREGECVVYSGNTLKEYLGDNKSSFWGSRRLWLAQYGNNPTWQKSWESFWLWQYSDGQHGPQPHAVAGINDDVDSNSFNGTPEQLKAEWATGKAEPHPEPAPEVPEVVILAPPGVKVTVKQQT